MSHKLAKLADIKTMLNLSGTSLDTQLTTLLKRATALAEGAGGVGYSLKRVDDRIEYPDVGGDGYTYSLYLDVFPVVSITSVKQLYSASTNDEFEAATALTEFDDYVLNNERGILKRINGRWCAKLRTLQVIYTAGYSDPDEDPMPGDAILPPDDLQQGILMQAIKWLRIGPHAGSPSVSGGTGASAQFDDGAMVPELAAACQALRRFRV